MSKRYVLFYLLGLLIAIILIAIMSFTVPMPPELSVLIGVTAGMFFPTMFAIYMTRND